ncbi:hypothetical protein Bca52824_081322 [Brassica carinata]|uniref:Uncharacterized protein n=1 Tax=Brassica carinata TaxID=52824 RepID=A0A8X7PG53_BRACI|nr:hypothetical protein Bca52824_081322 [Brassica carinata]
MRWMRFRGEVDKGSTEAASIDTTTSLSIDTCRVSEQKEFEAPPCDQTSLGKEEDEWEEEKKD